MLYKTIIAAFVVSSGDALRIDGLSTRRAVIGTASALLVPLAAFAEEGKLKRAGDAEIYARADDGKLSATRVIERAKTGDLADGSSANCDELDSLIAVDRKALKESGVEPAVKDKVQDQINKLDSRRKDKGCTTATTNLKQAGDFDVYERADAGALDSARVIERAREGKLVDGAGASLKELSKIIAVDKKAIMLEKAKLEALGDKASKDDKKNLEASEKAIATQITKLENLRRQKRVDKDEV